MLTGQHGTSKPSLRRRRGREAEGGGLLKRTLLFFQCYAVPGDHPQSLYIRPFQRKAAESLALFRLQFRLQP
jgi:hypothetical protein